MDKWIGTWASVEHALHAAGIDAAVIDDIRVATAHARHAGRMHAAYWAAKRWVKNAFYGIGDDAVKAYAYALCFAESLGLYGGGAANPGAGTTRHPAFRGLGKGRRHATDGKAWTAAIAAVAEEVGATFSVMPDGRLAVHLINGDKGTFVPVGDLLHDDWWARRNLALHAARYGWAIMSTNLIEAAARELVAVEAEAQETAEPTEADTDDLL